jgi:hypothetical protein
MGWKEHSCNDSTPMYQSTRLSRWCSLQTQSGDKILLRAFKQFQRGINMTLITKFKTGRTEIMENVDDVDHDDEYVTVWFESNKIMRCKTAAVKYYIVRYAIGGDITVYPDRE